MNSSTDNTILMTMIICSESEFLGENCQMTRVPLTILIWDDDDADDWNDKDDDDDDD